MYLLQAIDRFRREFPHITVTVHRMLASHIPEELNLRTFELGMISFRPDPAQFRTIAVYADSLAFIVSPSHPLAGAERVSINDLGEELFVAHNVASPLRRKVIEAFQRYRTPLNMGIELPTIEAIKRFVAMGNGVALVPHLTVARELETGDLVRVPVDELEIKRVLRLVHRRRPRSPMPPGLSAHVRRWPRSRDRPSTTMWSGPGYSKKTPGNVREHDRSLARSCVPIPVLQFRPPRNAPLPPPASKAQMFSATVSPGPPRPVTMLRAGPGSNRRAGIDKLVASRTVEQS
jgi:hypothetical protein